MPPTYDEATAVELEQWVRSIAGAMPGVQERSSHGAAGYFVRGKKMFATLQVDFQGDGRLGLWCAAPEGVQATLIETEPDRFFKPPYYAQHGWIGCDLALDFDPEEARAIIDEAYRCVAPKMLIKQLDGDS